MSMYDCIYICVYNNKITTVYLNNFIGDIDAKLLRTCCKILIRFWSAGSVCYSFMISMKYCKTWWQYWQWWWWWWWWWWWHQMTVWKRKTLIMAPGSQSSHGTWLWINMTMARNNGRVTRGKRRRSCHDCGFWLLLLDLGGKTLAATQLGRYSLHCWGIFGDYSRNWDFFLGSLGGAS